MSNRPHAPFTGLGICQQQQSPLNLNPALPALLVNLDQWVSNGTAPPSNQVPTRSDGTLVAAQPQSAMGFPAIPGVTYNGRTTTGDLLDFGPLFGQGIMTKLPRRSRSGRTRCSCQDRPGRHRPRRHPPAGQRSPARDLLGLELRAAAFAGGDGCGNSGQVIPFAQTKPDRLAQGDPRLSVAERYPSHQAYVTAVTQAANTLFGQRFLLGEGVQAYVSAAAASNVAVDTPAPVLTLPADIEREATGPTGAVVDFAATGGDNWDLNPTVTCTPPIRQHLPGRPNDRPL